MRTPPGPPAAPPAPGTAAFAGRGGGVLKDKEIIGQEDRLKGEGEGKTTRNRTRQRKERGGGNRTGEKREKDRMRA